MLCMIPGFANCPAKLATCLTANPATAKGWTGTAEHLKQNMASQTGSSLLTC